MFNLRNSLFISFVGHLAVWGIFSFSFGGLLQRPLNSPVYFWGQLLHTLDMQNDFSAVTSSPIQIKKQEGSRLLLKKSLVIPKDTQSYYFKPAARLEFSSGKVDFHPEAAIGPYPYKKQDTMIMLHPLLPEYFMLLFKDRQLVNIALEFKIIESKGRSFTLLKRKISSGNLQADLLTMRYISHYLFIQGKKFAENSWQTITIELSAFEKQKYD
ncbi:MAG: hypothetical protein C4540_05875 [Candidatus Omnitrophota bacterium]|jgi:hypothetical protein|nr:MAG: hypothetical protein C4540_05875 [Candidatus Omnitrophota bacterium]